MLTIKNLSFAYGTIQTLTSVDMTISRGEVTCILGRNGVGKTTLLKNIMGTRAQQLLANLGFSDELRERQMKNLSGGWRVRVALAAALFAQPDLLLLDEPTEGIQPNVIQQIGEVLKTLVEERGMTVLLVEQYLEFIKEFGKKFYVLNRGRVVADGETSDLSTDLAKKYLSI